MPPAACTLSVRMMLAGPPRPGRRLGRHAGALWIGVGPDVLAVLTPSAVRLPCALLVEEIPADGPIVCGDDVLRVGDVRLRPVRTLSATVPRLAPDPIRSGQARAIVPALCAPTTVGALLGWGPGLTPLGDDVLVGFLVAARAWGIDVGPVRQAVLTGLGRTTTLSAALLRHAADGETIPELVAFMRALTSGQLEPAAERLLAVGHTSGAGLATGALAALDGRLAAA